MTERYFMLDQKLYDYFHGVRIRSDASTNNFINDNALGSLPEWNLSDLYTSPSATEIARDLEKIDALSTSFSKKFKNKLATLSPQEMLDCMNHQEKLQSLMGRLMSFASLRYYQLTTDSKRTKFLSDIQEKITDFSSKLVFFSLEFNTLSETQLKKILKKNLNLSRYKHAFKRMRAFKPYQLNNELEQFLHDQSVVGASAWNKLFDETMAGLKFIIDKESMSLEETLDLLTDPNRSKRKKSAKALSKTLKNNITLFSRITNTLVKEKSIEDTWRKLPEPQFSRHLSNDIEPEVVEALRNAVIDSYPMISHRYYKLKAKWMGLKKLEIWDRNAPLPQDQETLIKWEDAKSIVLEAYNDFDPRMAKLATPFFDNGWIDAGVKPGKAPGAFAHPTVTTVHPYIMLNYLGKPRDVMTLAHELGHGIHQTLAAKQGEILSRTPLTLAETASVFGEMLVFQKMIAESKSERARRQLLAGKVEDMINTVIRQISFYNFELELHLKRRDGELTADQINNIWLNTSKQSLGSGFNYMKGYETFWTYIPHFIHSPFYVYAYAFGDGLVNALYSVYQNGVPGFENNYFELLSSGGSQHHSKLLKPFGLDASNSEFWSQGLNLIKMMIDDLEAIES